LHFVGFSVWISLVKTNFLEMIQKLYFALYILNIKAGGLWLYNRDTLWVRYLENYLYLVILQSVVSFEVVNPSYSITTWLEHEHTVNFRLGNDWQFLSNCRSLEANPPFVPTWNQALFSAAFWMWCEAWVFNFSGKNL
jgi:hypothetical protein